MHITFKNIWGKDDDLLKQQVKIFWSDMQALPLQVDADDRASQLLFVGMDGERVIGVTTAHRAMIRHLNNNALFNFRLLIHPEYRIPGLADKFCVISRDFLEDIYLQGRTDCIGMITLAENQRLKEQRNEAVWPSSGFTYIGNTKAGHPIRILYFKGAKV